jgi:hypothetical protein
MDTKSPEFADMIRERLRTPADCFVPLDADQLFARIRAELEARKKCQNK